MDNIFCCPPCVVFGHEVRLTSERKARPAGFEPTTLGSEGLDTTGIHRPPKVTQLITANVLRTSQQAPLALLTCPYSTKNSMPYQRFRATFCAAQNERSPGKKNGSEATQESRALRSTSRFGKSRRNVSHLGPDTPSTLAVSPVMFWLRAKRLLQCGKHRAVRCLFDTPLDIKYTVRQGTGFAQFRRLNARGPRHVARDDRRRREGGPEHVSDQENRPR